MRIEAQPGRDDRVHRLPDWKELSARLACSAFRSRFRLGRRELDYLQRRGREAIRTHAEDFVRQRLAAAAPRNDGRQTPMRGHPVFVAQHATATCCRGCLAKWHRIPAGRELATAEVAYVVEVIMRWIARQPGTAQAPTAGSGE